MGIEGSPTLHRERQNSPNVQQNLKTAQPTSGLIAMLIWKNVTSFEGHSNQFSWKMQNLSN